MCTNRKNGANNINIHLQEVVVWQAVDAMVECRVVKEMIGWRVVDGMIDCCVVVGVIDSYVHTIINVFQKNS